MKKKHRLTSLLILITSIILFLVATGTIVYMKTPLFSHYFRTHTVTDHDEEKEPAALKPLIVHVFIHGSFGSAFSLFSIFDLIQDKIRGSAYHKVIKKMRKDDHFYKDQPILQRGLVEITPSFDLTASDNKKYAVYPLLKAFQTVESQISSTDHPSSVFYTFGWTGLISQTSRRLESIRLYNELQALKKKYMSQGFDAKFYIYAHSHGGNLVMNFALINEALQYRKAKEFEYKKETDPDHYESLLCMHQALSKLKPYTIASLQKPQKCWDFYPLEKNITIKNLVLYGCPIQPETSHCAFSTTFENVYNFYSDEDVIQTADWASTKRYYSERKFTPSEDIKLKNRIIQARIMVDRDLTNLSTLQQTTPYQASFLQRLLTGTGIFGKQTHDPNHKELWFFSWNEEITDTSLSPLPTMVLTPLFLALLNKEKGFVEANINIALDPDTLTLSLIDEKNSYISETLSLPASFIKTLKEFVLHWCPSSNFAEKEYSLIQDYLKSSV